MVKVTMDQIMDFENSDDFFEGTVIPLKGAYKINKIKKNVEKEADFYREKFQGIVDTYAKKNEDGSPQFSEDGDQILIQEDKIEECNKALEELQNLEVEIENYNLAIEDLGEGVEITPDKLEALMPFFS